MNSRIKTIHFPDGLLRVSGRSTRPRELEGLTVPDVFIAGTIMPISMHGDMSKS
ncbi:hypothetical protein UM715_14765 [Staphylococcus aureus]|nr:hypothetical protein UM715_14765 [Staphylococcus aureus]